MKPIAELLDDAPACCGNTGAQWSVVFEILDRSAHVRDEGAPCFYDAAEDASSRWVETMCVVLTEKGWLEHGSTHGWSWLTEKGKAVHAFLEKYGLDEREWPKCSACNYIATIATGEECPQCKTRNLVLGVKEKR
jgi:rubrerythrin